MHFCVLYDNMTKVQRDKEAVVAEINKCLSAWTDGYSALSTQANISYYAARRALVYGLKNDTKLISSLCTFFKIENNKFEKVQNTTLESLTEVLRETWDGSKPHADLLYSLIKSTKPFKVRGRTS